MAVIHRAWTLPQAKSGLYFTLCLTWAVFAIFLSELIWEDDRSFCRVLLEGQIVALLFLQSTGGVAKYVQGLTGLAVLGTIFRVIVRI